jgi:SAM-dependent methyltransferase
MTEQKEWFESWFDTSYYHTLYKHRDFDEAERFIKNLLDYLNLPDDAICLDLACGKGRHSIFLNKNGLNVTGLDLSANSISEAKPFENDRLTFDVHDMREVYKESSYDIIFNLFTSFGYFDNHSDNLKVLKSMHEMLKPGGLVVIDFMNVHKTIRHLVESESKEIDGIMFNIERSYDGEHIFKNIAFEDNGKSYEYQERVQAINRSTFLELFKETDFEVLDTFGNFSLEPFDLESADRLIFIGKKR